MELVAPGRDPQDLCNPLVETEVFKDWLPWIVIRGLEATAAKQSMTVAVAPWPRPRAIVSAILPWNWPVRGHIGGMRLHAILTIAAGTMIAISAFLVLGALHSDRRARSPYAGLIDIQCSNPMDNELIPVEQTCEKPSPNAPGGR